MERIYTINLRRGFIKAPRWKKTPRAVKEVKLFITKHLKTSVEKVKLSTKLNNYLWANGMKNPPPRVRVKAVKDDKGVVFVDLFSLSEEKQMHSKKQEKQENQQREKANKTIKKVDKKNKRDKEEDKKKHKNNDKEKYTEKNIQKK